MSILKAAGSEPTIRIVTYDRSPLAAARIDHAACHPVKNSFRVPLRLLRESGQRDVRVALPLEVPS